MGHTGARPTGLRGRLAGRRPYEPDPGHAGGGRSRDTPQHRHDVVVVGGGVIGLVTAWRAAQRGLRSTVVDPEPGGGAARAAAGMLAPVTEVHYGEQALLGLNLAAARRYPGFAAELEEATGARSATGRPARSPSPSTPTTAPCANSTPSSSVRAWSRAAQRPRVPPPGAHARPRRARRPPGGRRPPGRPPRPGRGAPGRLRAGRGAAGRRAGWPSWPSRATGRPASSWTTARGSPRSRSSLPPAAAAAGLGGLPATCCRRCGR